MTYSEMIKHLFPATEFQNVQYLQAD